MKNYPQSGRITKLMKELSRKWMDHQNGEQNYKSKSGRITKMVKKLSPQCGRITKMVKKNLGHKVDGSPKG